MKDFGYTISRDRQIDYDSLSREIYKALSDMEPTVNACISCGTCAATCSAAQFTNFSLRRYILLLRRGEHKEVAENIDKCMLCGKCQLVCPMGVNTRNVIYNLQNILRNRVKSQEPSIKYQDKQSDSLILYTVSAEITWFLVLGS
jgi:heterodisulfide reductase subunit C